MQPLDIRLGRTVRHINAAKPELITVETIRLRTSLDSLEAASKLPQYSHAWSWLSAFGLLMAGGIREILRPPPVAGSTLPNARPDAR